MENYKTDQPPDDGIYQQYHRRVFAYHEAGHTVIAYRLGRKFDHVEIIPLLTPWLMQFGGSMGHINYEEVIYDETKTGVEVVDEVLSKCIQGMLHIYAGPIAEARMEIDPKKTSFMEYFECLEKCLDMGEGIEGSDYEAIESIYKGLENVKVKYVKPEGFPTFDRMYNPDKMLLRAINMVEKDWNTITRLAEVLIERSRLTYDEACTVIENEDHQ